MLGKRGRGWIRLPFWVDWGGLDTTKHTRRQHTEHQNRTCWICVSVCPLLPRMAPTSSSSSAMVRTARALERVDCRVLERTAGMRPWLLFWRGWFARFGWVVRLVVRGRHERADIYLHPHNGSLVRVRYKANTREPSAPPLSLSTHDPLNH